MPLHPGNSRGVISENIREMIASGHPQRQAVAAALSNADRHPRADGGSVPYIDQPHHAPVWQGFDVDSDMVNDARPYPIPELFYNRKGYMNEPGVTGARKGPQRTAAGGIVRRYADGGPTGTGIATVAPSPQAMDPFSQGIMQRYAQLPPEKLEEMAARTRGTAQGQMISRILQQRRMMPDVGAPSQADAAASPQGYAFGGAMSMSEASPWWERSWERGQTSTPHTGFIHSSVPGRTDQIQMEPPAGSYVVPADVVSGLGEGNSLAGQHVLSVALSTGPLGTQMPRGRIGRGPPAPPRPAPESRGGRHDDQRVPIIAAGGEYVLSPQQVTMVGGGNLNRGHRILDAFVKHVREKTAKTMMKLPGPKH